MRTLAEEKVVEVKEQAHAFWAALVGLAQTAEQAGGGGILGVFGEQFAVLRPAPRDSDPSKAFDQHRGVKLGLLYDSEIGYLNELWLLKRKAADWYLAVVEKGPFPVLSEISPEEAIQRGAHSTTMIGNLSVRARQLHGEYQAKADCSQAVWAGVLSLFGAEMTTDFLRDRDMALAVASEIRQRFQSQFEVLGIEGVKANGTWVLISIPLDRSLDNPEGREMMEIGRLNGVKVYPLYEVELRDNGDPTPPKAE